jgi:hypothetical protein
MHDVGREQSETVRGQVYLTQTSRLMEASLLEVQYALFSAPCQQTVPELAEHGKVEPRISQLQTEQVLPVDARPHRLSRLAVREVLPKLHQGDQGEAPRRQARLATGREKRREVLILEDGAEGISKREIGGSRGERRSALHAPFPRAQVG